MAQPPWETGAVGDVSRRPSVWGAAGDVVIRSGESTAVEKAGVLRKPSFPVKPTTPFVSLA